MSELRSKVLIQENFEHRSVLAPPLTPLQMASKRGLDVTISVALLLLFLPFLCLIALAVWVDSGRPIFFYQWRGGIGGKPFRIVKFRTMAVIEDGSDVEQARRGDPRVTRLGAFLRRYSLDEMPQLWNVLTGEMSLVGPRPHALKHDDEFDSLITGYRLRHRVKPGLTGLAQVNGWRGDTSSIEALAGRVNADIQYIENWSFWLDVQIIAKTACIVLFDKGAY